MALELVPLCTVDITLRDPIAIADGPAGTRLIIEVADAKVTGDRLSGHMKGQAAADWFILHGTTGTLDVRATLETDDGAVIFAQYGGRTDMSKGPGGAPLYVTPTFETGDDRYAWLNTIQAVGKGTLEGNQLQYEWYEVR